VVSVAGLEPARLSERF